MHKVTWRSPSNIALIKYWGKIDNQIPKNPSISFTLDNSYTLTTIEVIDKNISNNINVSLLFEGRENPVFQTRIDKYISNIHTLIPALKGTSILINSENSFPHSSGIASSASSMSALALCLVSLEKEISGDIYGFNNFYTKASYLARLGSGSAARSIYGGINLWGKTKMFSESSNEFSIDITNQCHEVFKTYNDAILIVSDKTKKVSSTTGHNLMNKHPFAEKKFQESEKNTELMLNILKKGEQLDFALLTENEALSLHAMMMTSNPGYLLIEPNTVALIEKIREFREESKIPVCFTLDAGANVHFLYPNNEKEQVTEFIKSKLLHFCTNNNWINDRVGNGPNKL